MTFSALTGRGACRARVLSVRKVTAMSILGNTLAAVGVATIAGAWLAAAAMLVWAVAA